LLNAFEYNTSKYMIIYLAQLPQNLSLCGDACTIEQTFCKNYVDEHQINKTMTMIKVL